MGASLVHTHTYIHTHTCIYMYIYTYTHECSSICLFIYLSTIYSIYLLIIDLCATRNFAAGQELQNRSNKSYQPADRFAEGWAALGIITASCYLTAVFARFQHMYVPTCLSYADVDSTMCYALRIIDVGC